MHSNTAYTVWRDDLSAYAGEMGDSGIADSYQLTKGDNIIPVGTKRWGMVSMVGILHRGKLLFVTEAGFNHACLPIS